MVPQLSSRVPGEFFIKYIIFHWKVLKKHKVSSNNRKYTDNICFWLLYFMQSSKEFVLIISFFVYIVSIFYLQFFAVCYICNISLMNPFTLSNKNKIKIKEMKKKSSSRYMYRHDHDFMKKKVEWWPNIEILRNTIHQFITFRRNRQEQHLYGSWINLASIKQSVRTFQEIQYIGLFTGSTLLLYLKNHTEHHYR